MKTMLSPAERRDVLDRIVRECVDELRDGAALAAVTAFPLSETTRRALRGALAALGRDLGLDSSGKIAS
jgi:hypothetical protein